MEVESGARKVLLADSTVSGYVGTKVFKFRLEEKVDGTSGRSLVVYRNNGWATPDPVTTQEYPILAVKCYADPDRDAGGQIKLMNAEDKAMALYRAVNKVLHGKRGVWWGAGGSETGILIVGCQRWKEPFIVREKDQHGQSAGDPLGDAVYAYVEYAIQTIH